MPYSSALFFYCWELFKIDAFKFEEGWFENIFKLPKILEIDYCYFSGGDEIFMLENIDLDF